MGTQLLRSAASPMGLGWGSSPLRVLAAGASLVVAVFLYAGPVGLVGGAAEGAVAVLGAAVQGVGDQVMQSDRMAERHDSSDRGWLPPPKGGGEGS